jgi:pSer/pThr/pTyr-binding forkhead associated (FHA) protein
MPLRLVSLDGRSDIPLKHVVVVGRGRRCDVRIESFRVSRRHCRLVLDCDVVRVLDLGSTNGTKINGQSIREGVLRPGDKLSIAHCRYHLEALSRD